MYGSTSAAPMSSAFYARLSFPVFLADDYGPTVAYVSSCDALAIHSHFGDYEN